MALQSQFTYPTVVIVTNAHQIPSQAPVKKVGGNSAEFCFLSYNDKIIDQNSVNLDINRDLCQIFKMLGFLKKYQMVHFVTWNRNVVLIFSGLLSIISPFPVRSFKISTRPTFPLVYHILCTCLRRSSTDSPKNRTTADRFHTPGVIKTVLRCVRFRAYSLQTVSIQSFMDNEDRQVVV